MILQALKEYYDRKAADPDSNIAPEGWERKEIPFLIVLDENGKFLQFEDTRENDGKKKRAKIFLVPQGVKKTSGIEANLLWDNSSYIFGIINVSKLNDNKREKALKRAPDQKKAFSGRIKSELQPDAKIKYILDLLDSITLNELQKDPNWQEIYETNPILSFRFENDKQLFCNTNSIRKQINNRNDSKTYSGICLITGESDEISNLHTSIKGVYGAQTSGANIVSFNLEPFRSFNKEQGLNAPVGASAMFAYTTALNTLLGKDSLQRLQVGDSSTVFWSVKKTRFESDFSYFFKEPEKDDPDANSRIITNLFRSVNTGTYLKDSGNEKFYVLGLSPNAARISIRFWQVGTVSDFATRIRQHFEDLHIIKPPSEMEYYSIWRLLVNIATLDKSENIPPNIGGDFMRAILNGTPYPATLLQAALRRIRSDTEKRVKPVRAALIKAYLNRYYRFHPDKKEKEIGMALDIEQPSIGYQLGRFFAVLEKIQEEANPGLNATIRERYYGAACSSPVTVFANLLRLKNHHLAKLENKGRVVTFERLLGEIVGRFNDFPSHLDLHEQGKFAIGYYHQQRNFYTKKNNNSENIGENNGTE
jgi:CRISPR-associated protein Csd1